MTAPGDSLVLASRADSDRDRFRFRTTAGVHSRDAFRGGDLLALERLWDRDLGHLLCVEAGYGVVGTVLADAAESVTMTESNARAADLCERNARANGRSPDVRTVADPGALDGPFDAAVYVPKPYVPVAVGCERIATALDALRPGGDLYLAAKPESGLGRYDDCLDEMAVETAEIGSRADWELVGGSRPAAFDPPTFVERRELTARIDEVELRLVAEPGLFAASDLDRGTRLLAGSIAFAADERVLDLCCGYGPQGTYAGLAADCEVWLSDADRRATRCAERTLAANGVDGTVVTADCVDAVRDRSFDRVVCNPPTHAGDGVLRDLFAGAADVLDRCGRLSVVHHRELDLSSHLRPFETAERAATGEQHEVVSASVS